MQIYAAPSPMLDFPIYLLYRAATATLSLLPLRILFAIGQIAGSCAWAMAGHYRTLARRNLTIAFGPNKTPSELSRLARQHFQRLGANVLCSVKLTGMPPDEILRHVTVENIESMDRAFRAGTPVVLVLSHLATWELFAQLMPKFVGYVRNSTVYQKLGNRFIDEHVRNTRRQTGLELFDRKAGFQPVIDLLRSGGGVGVLSDQHAGDQGIWTPFFGRVASTSPLAALLAKRSRAALIAAAVYTTGPARWRMVFTERFDDPSASVEAMTLKANEIIEQQIQLAPEDWFWVHNRWKTPRPRFLLARYKRGVYVPSDTSPKNLKPFRILIRSSNWLGDAVMSIPATRAIKKSRPDAHVTVLTPAKLAPVWRLVPEVDEVISLDSKFLFSTASILRRKTNYDVAILFPNSLRVALETWLGGIPRRVGYRGHSRAWLLNQIVREPREVGPMEHQSERYLRIAHECGADVSKVEFDLPKIAPATGNGSLKIGLCPGAEYGPTKRWLPERFAETAKTINEKKAVQWVLLGTAKESEIGKQIGDLIGQNHTNRIGQTDLTQLIDELRECRLLLTNDTGTMHLGALLGIPVVAIFGSTEPQLTGPLGPNHTIVRRQVECSPCFLRQCPLDFRCMKEVTVPDVVDAVMLVLGKEGNRIG